VDKNYGKAFSYFKLAALKDKEKAMFYLYQCYTYGRGVSENSKEAEKWLRIAAIAGYNDAYELYIGMHGDEKDEILKLQNQWKKEHDTTFVVNGVEFTMVFVKGGTFMMGSELDDKDKKHLIHKVTLDDYFIGQTEVTQELWQAVMGNNPSEFKGYQCPVHNVSWEDCLTFIRKLNDLTGKKFHLPTEAQWEYAARGGNKSKGYKYSGSDAFSDVGWYEENCGGYIHEVMEKKANELGIFDMSGNIIEWCFDSYDENYYQQSSQNNPTGPSKGYMVKKVIRGGCVSNSSRLEHLWSVYGRNGECCDMNYNVLGLRLALSDTHIEIPVDKFSHNKTFVNDNNIDDNNYKEFHVNGVSFKMIYVEGGEFEMETYENNQRLEQRMTLKDFYIGQAEVTQELWQAVMNNNPSWHKGPKNPVERISGDDIQKFLKKLNKITGQNFHLPTEAQWEYAAKGGNKSLGYKYSGSDTICDVAWYRDNADDTHQVMTRCPNELGIYDMTGNVGEYCLVEQTSTSHNKSVKSGSKFHDVIRGGCYFQKEDECVVTSSLNRGEETDETRGFRIVL